MATLIQKRRDTRANWVAQNPILADGEEVIETDTKQRKLGDGVTRYNNLPYHGNPCLQDKGTSTTEAMSQNAVTQEFARLQTEMEDTFLVDYGNASSVYGGVPSIDYGNASTQPIDL